MLEMMLSGGKIIEESKLPEGWTKLVSLYPLTALAQGVAVGKYLYFYGGADGGNFSKVLWRYDTRTGGWVRLADGLEYRAYGQALTFNNKLYLFGGKVTPTLPSGYLMIYNIATNTWSYGATTVAAFDFPVVQREGLMYLLGGQDGNNGATPRFTRYNPVNNTYTPLADHPVRSSYLGVSGGTLFDLGDGSLYSAFTSDRKVGGGSATTNVYRYDIAANTWTLLPTPTPTYFFDIQVAVINGTAYFYGGAGGNNGVIYSFDGVTWKTIPQSDPKPAVRSYSAMASVNGSFFLLGGNIGATLLNELWAFTPPSALLPEPVEGVVSGVNFITMANLATAVGVSSGSVGGTPINQNDGWFHWINTDGSELYIAERPIRHSITWEAMDALGIVKGAKTIVVRGRTFKVRFLLGATTDPSSTLGREWTKYIIPWFDGTLGSRTSDQLGIIGTDMGKMNMLQEVDPRGGHCAAVYRDINEMWYQPYNQTNPGYGWRPVLELVP